MDKYQSLFDIDNSVPEPETPPVQSVPVSSSTAGKIENPQSNSAFDAQPDTPPSEGLSSETPVAEQFVAKKTDTVQSGAVQSDLEQADAEVKSVQKSDSETQAEETPVAIPTVVAESSPKTASGFIDSMKLETSVYPPEPIPPLSGKTVWILDAHAILYQVFHAIPEMTTPDGQPINAIYGMTRDLLGILENHRPDYLLCAFDLPKPTVRHQRYAAYKATRKEMPLDLQSQIPLSHQLLDAFAVPGLQYQGYEADDILATVAQTVELAGGTCVLVTADKDSRQLLADRVKIWLIRKNKFYTTEDLKLDWGIRPDQAVDFQALVGDSSDNVPGVPKIGPKTASTLLNQLGSLEEILKNTDKITAKGTRKNIEENIENAKLSQELVRLYCNVPINIPWTAAFCNGPNESKLNSLLNKWGFRSLITKTTNLCRIYRESAAIEDEQTVCLEEEYIGDGQSGIMHNSFDGVSSPADSPQPSIPDSQPGGKTLINTKIINSPELLSELVGKLESIPMLSLFAFGNAPIYSDVPAREQKIIGLSIATDENTGYYLPMSTNRQHLLESEIPALDLSDCLKQLKPILENKLSIKVGYDLKRTRNLLRAAGIELQGETFDVMIADALAAPGELSHSLFAQSLRWFDYTAIDITDVLVSSSNKVKKTVCFDEIPLETMAGFAAEQAVLPVILYRHQLSTLDKLKQLKLAQRIEFPLEKVLANMEFTGVRVDLDFLSSLTQKYTRQIESLRSDIFTLAGEEFNLDSPRQLQTILFEKLNLPKQRKIQTGTSTDADVLQTLSEHHPIAAKILEYRALSKLKGTYTDALPALVYPPTGRIHCSFNQTITATGRLSSTHPNLQNIPIRTPEGREIRRAFTAGKPGWLLIDADYSQIELRVLAHVCQDAALEQAFRDDLDIHAQVASEILNIPLAEITPEQRSSAKAVNFGIIYGQSSFGLARSLGISNSQAATFIEAYFARFPAIHNFLDQTLNSCCKNGYVETLWGRRRYLEGVRNSHQGQLNTTERMAINTVIQGTAADIIKAAMIDVDRKLKEGNYQSRLLIQIHDELLLESPPEEVEAVKELLVYSMEHIVPLRVPLKVDANVGPNWAQAH